MTALKDYHVPFYREFEKMLDKEKMCLYVACTGGGKTRCCDEYLRTHNYRALVVVPDYGSSPSWTEYLSDITTVVKYQGFSRHYKEYIKDYDVIIFDESHHANGRVWGMSIKSCMEEVKETKIVIGLTATPIVDNGNVDIGKEFFKKCIVYGPTDQWMIEHGYFNEITLIQAILDYGSSIESESSTLTAFGSLCFNIDNAEFILKTITDKIDDMSKHKGIIYVEGIPFINRAIQLFKRIIPKEMIKPLHSDLPQKTIDETMKWFMNCKHGYIVAVNMISEGAHPANLDIEVQLRKTKSYRLYIQQVGRLRSEGVKEPILFDFAGNTATVQEKLNEDKYRCCFGKRYLIQKRRASYEHSLKKRNYTRKITDQRIIDVSIVPLSKALNQNVYIVNDGFDPDDREFILDHYWEFSTDELITRLENKYTTDEINSFINNKNKEDCENFKWIPSKVAIFNYYYQIEGAACYKRIPGATPYIVKERAYRKHLIGPDEFAIAYRE